MPLMDAHEEGLDVLGASAVRGLFLRVKDPVAVVKAQGGAVGSLAQSIAPKLVEGKIYEQITGKLQSGFREQGVDVEISPVEIGPQGLRAAEYDTGKLIAGIFGGVFLGGVLGFLLGKRKR